MRIKWLILPLAGVLLAGFVRAGGQTQTALKKGKKGDITVTSILRMDGVTLQPGEYTVQHRTSGSDHYIRLTKWETGRPHPKRAPDLIPTDAGVVRCEVQPVDGKIKKTRVYTETIGKDTWVTKIEVKGENVVHIIPTAQ